MPMTTPSLKVDAVRALGAEVVLHGDSYSDAYAARARARRHERGLHLRASVRRPRRDRRPGHDRDGDPAPAPGPDRRGLRRRRRRRPDLRRRRVRQGGAARDPGHRRADDRLRRDDPLGRAPASASSSPTSACSPTAPPSSRSARRRSAWRASWSTTSSSSTPTPSAPRSRTCSRTRAASSSRPARSASPRSSSTSQAQRRRGTRRCVAITCGANMNFDRLRFVAERAEVGEEREALFAVTIPEERGSFRRFCELIGAARRHRVQLPDLRRARRPTSSSASRRSTAPKSAQLARHFAEHGFADARPDRRRARQGARPPHGRRPQPRWPATSGSTASSSRSGRAR